MRVAHLMVTKAAQANINRLRDLHQTMLTIRACETALIRLFADGEVPGFIHLSLGQEGVAAGVCGALKPHDTLATTHRGHGHVIARGIALDGFFKELMGRSTGVCGGRSGSMHVADVKLGILGANGIVGASLSIALGSALGHQVLKTNGIATAFFGDGAMAEGALYETLNMATLWHLPLLLVCENNGWSEFSPTALQFKGTLAGLADTFGVLHRQVDGNDVEAVAVAAQVARDWVVTGGPYILECITSRVRGHFEGDPQKYREASELAALEANDPINRSLARLRELGQDDAVRVGMADAVDASITAAIEDARAAPLPDFTSALNDVYTPDEVSAHG